MEMCGLKFSETAECLMCGSNSGFGYPVGNFTREVGFTPAITDVVVTGVKPSDYCGQNVCAGMGSKSIMPLQLAGAGLESIRLLLETYMNGSQSTRDFATILMAGTIRMQHQGADMRERGYQHSHE